MVIFPVFFFVLGTIIGSFLNVVILRYNTGVTVAGRSRCFSCSKTLVWYELIPLFSYLFLRGKCSSCKSKISIQYPLVEALTAILFLGIYIKFAPLFIANMAHFGVVFAVHALIFSFLVVILVYDMQHTIIPDGMVYSFIAVALAARIYFLVVEHFSMTSIWDALAGVFFFTFFFLLWFISKGTWMGFGDAKLVLGIGLLLGLSGGLSALFLAFWIGSVVGIVIMLFQNRAGKSGLLGIKKQITMKTEIPFAPFLILGLWLVVFFEINVFHLFLFS